MDKIDQVLGELPAGIVTTDQDIIATYTTDFRRQFTGKSPALLRPRTTEDVRHIVAVCNRYAVPLVPQGGNTGYCAAATPSADNSQLLISLERMVRIRDLDAANLSITAEAGAILADLQEHAANAGLLFPLSLGSEQSCRIGGNLSTNAGGVSVVRYGMARDILLGLEVVLPDATVLHDLHPLRKDNSGYDVKQLFVGAEGTLGIITAASLKLFRRPRQSVTAFLALDNIENLGILLDRAQIYTGEAITSFEYISHTSLQLLLGAKPQLRHPLAKPALHYVLLEAATPSPILDLDAATLSLFSTFYDEGLIIDGVIAASHQQSKDFWQLREDLPEAENHHGGSIKHDVSVRVSRVSDFIGRASEIVARHANGARLSVYGHVGDGNIHFNVLATGSGDTMPDKAWIEREVSPRLYDLAMAMGGSFSAEYGIGQTKLAALERYGDSVKVGLMERLKQSIDPGNIMNPGKVVQANITRD